jgi:hypothetical protein
VKELFARVLLKCCGPGLIGGELFAIDGCKLPSNASKERSGTLEELGKKKQDLEALMEKIMGWHVQLDKQAEEERELSGAAYSYVYEEGWHLERIEGKLRYIDTFLAAEEERKGAGGEEVKSDIRDNESGKIKGGHGYIQGYNGIAVADSKNQVIVAAEAFGSGSESEYFPGMLDALEERMGELSGKEEPLEEAIVEGDRGYVTEKNLKAAEEGKIEVIIPDQQFRKRNGQFEGRPEHGGTGRFTAEDFEYVPVSGEEGAELQRVCAIEEEQRGEVSGEKQRLQGLCVTAPMHSWSRGKKSPKRTLFIADKSQEENLCDRMRKKIDEAKYRVL